MVHRDVTSSLNDAARPAALPSSEFNLTTEEKAMLADPNWITPDEADGIICMRRDREGGAVDIEDMLSEHGISLED
jgi:hypothetical protein